MDKGARRVGQGNLSECALQCITCADPQEKCRLTEIVHGALEAGELGFDTARAPVPIPVPGRPDRPRLVSPRDLPRRRLGSTQGRISLLHALAHIEFNAINLAWDAVYRFRGLPHAFYRDWARVAFEESRHFRMLSTRLCELGSAYGRLDAHNGLWEMACRTAHDPLARMALVPRVLEARGLDVTPGIIERLTATGDAVSVEILQVILRDEIGHVEIGTRWYRWLCEARGLAPEVTFVQLLEQYMKGEVKRPFHYAARRQAGFNRQEMQCLEELAARGTGGADVE
ncbi:MAG: ferritin-like domain-containing protein [Gammaproteobacteria bacterium]|jgi:uncharacterized ferritin-like protein (DUF455 family)